MLVPLGFVTLVILDVFFYMGALVLELSALVVMRRKRPARDGLFVIGGGRAGLYLVAALPMLTWCATFGLALTTGGIKEDFIIAIVLAATTYPAYALCRRIVGRAAARTKRVSTRSRTPPRRPERRRQRGARGVRIGDFSDGHANRAVKAYFQPRRPGPAVCTRGAARKNRRSRVRGTCSTAKTAARRLEATLEQARVAARSLIGAGESGGVSLCPTLRPRSTSLSASSARRLRSGEFAVTTDQEHPCVIGRSHALARAESKSATIGGGSPRRVPRNLRALIRRRRPGFAVFSHVSCKDGRVLPVEEAGAILAQQEIPYIVDGAQALGQVAVDVAQIEAWAYAFTGHKWLFGPMGTGGLWTDERFLRANPLAWTGPMGFIRKGGGELESGSLNCALFAGMAEALRTCAEEFPSRVETLMRLRARIAGLLDGLYENTASKWDGPHAPGILAYGLPPADTVGGTGRGGDAPLRRRNQAAASAA